MHSLPCSLVTLPPTPGEIGFTAFQASDLGRGAGGPFYPSLISLLLPLINFEDTFSSENILFRKRVLNFNFLSPAWALTLYFQKQGPP